MEEVKIITLDDGIDYQELDSLIYNQDKYILLSNVNDPKDICIRKIQKENEKEYICRIEEEKIKIILSLFVEKNRDILEGNN